MNSEERHNMQKNELEEVIEDMPEMLKKHWMGIAGVVILVIVVLVSWTGLKHTVQKNKKDNQQAMAKILVSRSQAQVASASSAANYNTVAEISNLSSYAGTVSGTPAGYNAMIQEANTILSELYFSNTYLTADEKTAICDKAAKAFETVASQYSKNASAVCMSQIGLAAIATELGQWDKAEEIYNGILAKKDILASTAFPAMAQTRLTRLKDLKKIEAIEFAPAPKAEAVIEDVDVAPAATETEAAEVVETPEATN